MKSLDGCKSRKLCDESMKMCWGTTNTCFIAPRASSSADAHQKFHSETQAALNPQTQSANTQNHFANIPISISPTLTNLSTNIVKASLFPDTELQCMLTHCESLAHFDFYSLLRVICQGYSLKYFNLYFIMLKGFEHPFSVNWLEAKRQQSICGTKGPLDCSARLQDIFFQEGEVVFFAVLWEGGKEGELREICCQFVLKMKICFSLWCFFSREITPASLCSSPLIFWPRNWNVVINFSAFFTLSRKAFNRVIYTKGTFKTGLKNGDTVTATLTLHFFYKTNFLELTRNMD